METPIKNTTPAPDVGGKTAGAANHCRNTPLSITPDILDNIDIAMIQIDPDYRILKGNRKATDLYGDMKPGDLCYQRAVNRDSICDACPAKVVFESGENSRSEFKRTTASGREIHLEHVATPVKDVDGHTIGALIMIIDITDLKNQERAFYENEVRLREEIAERKRIEAALRESEERLDLALSGANEGIWDWNLENNEVHFDSRYYTISGYEPYEFPGAFEEWEKRVHPDDIKRTTSAIRDYLAGIGDYYDIEFRFLRKNGEYMWIHGKGKVVAHDEQGNPTRFIGTHSDIDQRKQMEKSLLINQFSFDKAAIGIYRIDLEARILEVNEEAARMLGYTKEELETKTIFDIDPSVNVDNQAAIVEPVIRHGFEKLERTHRRKDGTDIQVEIHSNLLEYEGQQYSIAFVQDITARKQIEKSLRITQFSFDKAAISIHRIDSEARILEVNEEAARMLGYTKEELETKTIMDIDPEVTKETWGPIWQTLLQYGLVKFERVHRRKDGAEIQVEIHSNLLEYEGQSYAIAFSQNITERKRSQEALQKSETRLREAQKMVGLGYWTWDIASGDVEWSEEVFKIFRLNPDEFTPQIDSIMKLSPWEGDNIRHLEIMERAILNREKGTFEQRFLRPDGSVGYYHSTFLGRYDTDGNLVAIEGTVLDVTERKRSEEALLKSEARLRDAQKMVGLGYWTWNVGTGDVEWTDEVYKIFRLKPDEFTPQIDSIMKLSPWEEDNTRHMELIEHAIQSREKGEFEQRFLRPDESIGYYHSTFQGRYDSDGELVFIEGAVMDVTERKLAENEMRKLRNYLSNIINSMPSILVGVDNEGRVTQWNKQAELTTGLTLDMVHSQPLDTVLPWLGRQMDRVKAAVSKSEVIKEPKIPRQQNGETHFEDLTIYPLIANGVEGAVIRIDDVTERVHLEEMMIQGEKMLSVGGLAAGMAHEINNPLAGMMQTAEVMANRLSENLYIPANQKAAEAAGTTLEAVEKFMSARGIPRMLATINASGKRVAEIVGNMLSFARKSESTVSTNDLEALIDKTLELASTDYDLKKQYDFKRIEIDRQYASDLPAVPCEGAKIQQVLLNIFRNGAQAMKEAGTENPTFTIRTQFEKERQMACLEIEDNGPGMGETTRRRAFEPFFTTKKVGVGTGLGLSVSYFIITENHGGEMAVESRPGTGTKFIIRLPLKRE